MTTSYAQTVYARAAREVAEQGSIRQITWDAFRDLGLSEEAIAGLEQEHKSAQRSVHQSARQ